MSDHYLLWVKVPPPRVAKETTLTFIVAAALAIYAIPVVTAVDPDTIPVELDDLGDVTCCWCGDLDPAPEDPDERTEPERSPDEYTMRLDRPVSREEAIEQALSHSYNIGTVGVLGSLDELIRPSPSHSAWFEIEDGIEELGGSNRPWRGRSFPQLATRMQPLHANPFSTFSIVAQGSLDRGTVRRYLKRQAHEVARCDNPMPSLQLGATRAEGVATVQFLIDRDGRVARAIPYGSSVELIRCLEQTISTFRFPRSDGLTQVVAPLRYGTTDASAGAFVR